MENKQQPRKLIKCPHCGWEYLPGEIFYPVNTIGQPINIIRDTLGHIIYEEYKPRQEPESNESFTCENCNRTFVVDIELSFKAKPEEEVIDFSNLSVSLF